MINELSKAPIPPQESKPLTLVDIKGPARGYDGPPSFYGLSPEDRIKAAKQFGSVEHIMNPGDQRMAELIARENKYYQEHGVVCQQRKRPADEHIEFIVYQPKQQDLADAGYGLSLSRSHPTRETEDIRTRYLREVADAKAGITPQQKQQQDNKEFIEVEWKKILGENPGRTRIIWGLEADYLFVKEET